MLELLYFGCNRNNWSISVVESLLEQEQDRTATRMIDNDNSDVNDSETWCNQHYKSMMFAMGLHIIEQERIDVAFRPKFLLKRAPKAIRNVGAPPLGTLVENTTNSSHISNASIDSNIMELVYVDSLDIAVVDSHDDVDLGGAKPATGELHSNPVDDTLDED